MTADLVVLIPSRGRPEAAAEAVDAIEETKSPSAAVDVIVRVDQDDDTLDRYRRLFHKGPRRQLRDHVCLMVGPRLRLGPTLNDLVSAPRIRDYRRFGFLGDDHRPRTASWDVRIADQMSRDDDVSVVYGDDGFQGPNLPTAVFLGRPIIDAVGGMAPPGLTHLFLDNAWKLWGETVGRLRYLADVKIEHLHPQAGKADWDDRYREVNSGDQWSADAAAWETYRSGPTWRNHEAALRRLGGPR